MLGELTDDQENDRADDQPDDRRGDGPGEPRRDVFEHDDLGGNPIGGVVDCIGKGVEAQFLDAVQQ